MLQPSALIRHGAYSQKSVVRYARTTDEFSNHHIARAPGFPGEKALNNFANYHTGYCPTHLKTMPEEQVHALLEKLGSKIRE
ncbi:hypothetical protein [Fodinibius sediminis]|uniref:hypothetical protein n=1 Tax=Fodinibius sediminis TaxID=1214077 RepID=UPI0011579324|nr:hypothetical protein [Fodinibius sediminis]